MTSYWAYNKMCSIFGKSDKNLAFPAGSQRRFKRLFLCLYFQASIFLNNEIGD